MTTNSEQLFELSTTCDPQRVVALAEALAPDVLERSLIGSLPLRAAPPASWVADQVIRATDRARWAAAVCDDPDVVADLASRQEFSFVYDALANNEHLDPALAQRISYALAQSFESRLDKLLQRYRHLNEVPSAQLAALLADAVRANRPHVVRQFMRDLTATSWLCVEVLVYRHFPGHPQLTHPLPEVYDVVDESDAALLTRPGVLGRYLHVVATSPVPGAPLDALTLGAIQDTTEVYDQVPGLDWLTPAALDIALRSELWAPLLDFRSLSDDQLRVALTTMAERRHVRLWDLLPEDPTLFDIERMVRLLPARTSDMSSWSDSYRFSRIATLVIEYRRMDLLADMVDCMPASSSMMTINAQMDSPVALPTEALAIVARGAREGLVKEIRTIHSSHRFNTTAFLGCSRARDVLIVVPTLAYRVVHADRFLVSATRSQLIDVSRMLADVIEESGVDVSLVLAFIESQPSASLGEVLSTLARLA